MNKHENSFDATVQLTKLDALTLIRDLSEAVLRSEGDQVQFSVSMDYLHAKGEKYKVSFSTIWAHLETSKISAIVGGREVCYQLEKEGN